MAVTKQHVRTFVTLLILVMLGSSAWAASISGTVTNGTGKSGRIWLTAVSQYGGDNNLGVSISSAGAFTINGVQSGQQYTVRAFLDTQANGVRHSGDPAGSSAQVTATSGNVSVGSIAVTTPDPVDAQAPEILVYRGTGGNLVFWMDGPETVDGVVIADRYTVSWSASPTGSPVIGSKDVTAGGYGFFTHSGGLPGYYYQVKAVAGTTSASTSWTPVPAASGTGSVTGKVNFPGLTGTGPLYVLLVDFSGEMPKFNMAAVATPTSGGSYTFGNVTPGKYEVIAFRDLNNSGSYDAGDVGWIDNDDVSPTVTVATSPVAAADINLINQNAAISFGTVHQKASWGESFNIDVTVQPMKKRIFNVQIVSGPQISAPIDMNFDDDEFEIWINLGGARPTVGDAYQIKLSYSDGTSETVEKKITAVLDGFATPVAPVGLVPFNATPTFSWAPPSPAPAQYNYSLWVTQIDNNNWNDVWDVWGLPGSQTSIVYGSQGEVEQSTLTDGGNYSWSITVKDGLGNEAQRQVNFSPTSAPAIGGFSPVGGPADTIVTITGVNLNPDPASYVVLFSGFPATVSAATSTSLTVTVPVSAVTGKIQVFTGGKELTSASDFIVAATRSVTGVIQTSAGVAIAGARVEKLYEPGVYTTTAENGSFTLGGLFENQSATLMITKSGFVPTYSANYYLQNDLNISLTPHHLYTQAELTSWGVTSGNGAIVGQVLNSNATPFTPVGDVTVTAQHNGSYRPVTYYNGTSLGGTSTYANGIFSVLNVSDRAWIYLNGSKPAWNFTGLNLEARAGSVTEGGLFGYTTPPYAWSFSPVSGKAGTVVAISGSNFSSITTANAVKFNGVAATVIAANTTTLTALVPVGATTGPISVTTEGGTSNTGGAFTMINTLSASVAGSGGALGTVTSVPGGITCRGTSGCTTDFQQGTSVELIATADAGSVLTGWTGGTCSGTGVCAFVLNGDKAVGATFAPLQYLKNGSNYYSLLQSAFDAASNGTTLQAQSQLFTDAGLLFNRDGVVVKFKGGYDSSFLTNGGFTTLDGRLDIQDGTLVVERLKIK